MEENRTWGGEDGSDREFHQSREYQQDAGREYGGSGRQYRDTNHEEEKRKKKWNKISRYLLGTVSGAVVIAGTAFYEKPPAVELTELEKSFLQEVEQEFQENDLDGVLQILTGREISYAPDGRVKIEWENQLADIYHEISDKAAWNLEERLAILMGDDISVVPEGDGIGFCFDGRKLYYGQLKDGFPDGTGICYVVIHNYYSYSQGGWKEGYANDWMVSGGGYFERKENQDYFSAWETKEGFYNAGIAEGTVTLALDSLDSSEDDGYDSETTETAAYEVSNGQIVMDGHWKKNESGYYELSDEAGKAYVFDFDEYHLKELVRVEVEWLPVEASGFHQMPDENSGDESVGSGK